MIGSSNSLRLWHRFNRRWRRQLGHKRAMVALLALLTLGLFEPLACVLHCAIWMPLHLQSTPLAQAQLHHHHTVAQPGAGTSGSAAVPIASLDQMLGQDQAPCYGLQSRLGHDSSSHHTPLAQPFHEMALIVVTLVAVLLSQRYAAPRAHTPPPQFLLPLLRPPIA